MSKQDAANNFYYEIGFRLKQIRQGRGVSQEKLAGALGIAKQTIQKYESGEIRMSPEVIYQCARFFNISVGFLYGEDHNRQCNNATMLIASEMMNLPNESIMKAIYSLIRVINSTYKKHVHHK